MDKRKSDNNLFTKKLKINSFDNNKFREFEKENITKDIRTIKIYFTNLFRKDCVLNNNKKNKNNKLDSESYCEYIQDQLLRYLIKNPLFNDEAQN